MTASTPLLPNSPTAYSPTQGGIPAVPDPSVTQNTSLLNNLSNLSNLYNLSLGTGNASGAGGAANLNAALPGATGGIQNLLGLAQGEIAGQIDQPTINNLEQLNAERGAATGQGVGSPNSNAALMQALGRTTQGTEQLGAQNLSTAVGLAPVGPQFNPNQFLVTPEQQQSAQTYANQLAAAPLPLFAANANMNALDQGRKSAPTSPATAAPTATAEPSPVGASGFGPPPGSGGNTPYTFGLPGEPNYDWGSLSQPIDNGDGTMTDPMTGEIYDPATAGGGDYSSYGDLGTMSDYFGDF